MQLPGRCDVATLWWADMLCPMSPMKWVTFISNNLTLMPVMTSVTRRTRASVHLISSRRTCAGRENTLTGVQHQDAVAGLWLRLWLSLTQ